MIRTILFFLFFMAVFPGYSQSANQNNKLQAIVKFHPFALIDPNIPAVFPALELKSGKFGMQLNWGFNYDFYTMDDGANYHLSIHGNRLGLEFHRYSGIKENSFYGLTLFTTIYNRRMGKFEWYYKKTGSNYQSDSSTIYKKVFGIAAKTGWSINLSKILS